MLILILTFSLWFHSHSVLGTVSTGNSMYSSVSYGPYFHNWLTGKSIAELNRPQELEEISECFRYFNYGINILCCQGDRSNSFVTFVYLYVSSLAVSIVYISLIQFIKMFIHMIMFVYVYFLPYIEPTG